MQHLEEGTIHAWLDGALSATEAREVEEHVATCSECSAMVAEARGLIAGSSRIVSSLDVVRGNVIPKTPAAKGGRSLWQSLHLTPSRAALAATLMIAISSILTVRHNTAEKLIPPSTPALATDKIAVPAPAAAPSAGAPEQAARAQAADSSIPSLQRTQSTLASRAKDRPAVNEPMQEQRKAVNADVVDARRDLADAKAKQSLDSLSTIAQKPAVVAAAPAAAGAVAANVIQDSARKALEKAPQMEAARKAVLLRTAARTDQIALAGADSLICLEFRNGGPASPPNVPSRFALQGVPGDTTHRAIRVLAENGRPDSVLTGSMWSFASPTEVALRFAINQRTLVLPIRDVAARDVASAGAPRKEFARQQEPTVTRIACPP